jgi:uncharacterized protein YacL (UPF0231 family)
MDYEFSFDDDGKPNAILSMGHEVLGRWLTEELGQNSSKMVDLLAVIDLLDREQLIEKNILGRDLNLRLERESVEVTALEREDDEEFPEETNLYESESVAECGLLDFKQLLLDWQEFVA